MDGKVLVSGEKDGVVGVPAEGTVAASVRSVVNMPSPVMLRLLAATPMLPPTQLRDRTMLTTERTPAATVPSAGTPTTPSFSPDTKTFPPSQLFLTKSRSSGQ